MTSHPPHSHCHFCGAKYTDRAAHPTCPRCGEICWINPAPVAVCLTPVEGKGDRQGLLLVNRNLSPAGWALPGGYMETGEQVGQAALRELKEETGLAPDKTHTRVVDAGSTPTGSSVLIFVATQAIREEQLKEFRSDGETSEICAVWDQEQLEQAQIVFPMHAQQAKQFLNQLLHS